jgi:hypothetical protein
LTPLVLRCPYGLGDAIYIRPVIRDQALKRDVYCETPWPELYEDLPVRFIEPPTTLRVQAAQMKRQLPSRWSPRPAVAETRTLYYSAEAFSQGNVYQAMAHQMEPVARPLWDLPDMGPCPFDTSDSPLVIVRPCVVRKDWPNPSRNPRPEYVAQISGDLKARGYAVVVVCDLSAGEEWIEGEMPPHNYALTNGELSTRQLLASVQNAALLVGGVGWIVPAAIAAHTPAFIVLGGNGGANAPDKIIDPRMDARLVGFAWPETLCLCSDQHHQCRKDIPDLMQQWQAWRGSINL